MNDPDRMLSSESVLVPASGFTSSVMSAVRDEVERPPLPFPWKRFATGLCLSLVVTAAVLWFLLSATPQSAPVAPANSDLARVVLLASAGGLLTVVMVRGCRLLARR